LVAKVVARVCPRAQLPTDGVPHEGMPALATDNPLLLTGLITGLREEDVIRLPGSPAVHMMNPSTSHEAS
jgi:hypothetical protein